MYRKETEGWLKHYDFILLDLICLHIAFILAYADSGHGWNPYNDMLYRNMSIFLTLADLILIFSLDTLKNVLRRSYQTEYMVTIKHAAVLCGASLLYLFALQQGGAYSRLALFTTFLIYVFLTFGGRQLWKKVLSKRRAAGGERSLLIITEASIAEAVVEHIKENNYAGYTIAGAVIIESTGQPGEKLQESLQNTGYMSNPASVRAAEHNSKSATVQNTECKSKSATLQIAESNPETATAQITEAGIISGVPVVTDGRNVAKYVCREWIDEVIIVPSEHSEIPEQMIDELQETGVTIHLNLAIIVNEPGKKQFVEKIGGYTVLTTSINYASAKQLFVKRVMDIAAGLVGCLCTGIIFLFVAPIIYIKSPGPIFFAQERVGKNGKKFKLYKFRSMYIDAEERKAELMKENKMSDNKMFKIDFDPRVIGNRILPDGTQKKGFGQFLRDSSLDEFPQFWNVLRGDMSLVGTRPPIPGEVSEYELHHRARLAIKPGITGMWQVSGRSDITDFEEVVRLDKQYISEWSIWLDVKILFKTVGIVMRRKGAS